MFCDLSLQFEPGMITTACQKEDKKADAQGLQLVIAI